MNERTTTNGLLATAQALAPTRARPRTLERQQVIDVALDIADNEGLAGLTMRKLAERLRVSLATVYATAGSKEDILTALVDEVLSDLSAAPRNLDADDITAIIDLWLGAHERLVAHPAVAQLASAQPLDGKTVFRIVEETLNLLRRIGLDETAAVHAYTVLRSYLIGFTILRVSRNGMHSDEETARIDSVRGLPTDEFPTLRASADQLATQMTTEHFITGFRQLLVGVTGSEGPMNSDSPPPVTAKAVLRRADIPPACAAAGLSDPGRVVSAAQPSAYRWSSSHRATARPR